jgi:DNA-directed RNA polymerase specialized sigma24 family protein
VNLNKPVLGDIRGAALTALSEDQRTQLAAYAEIMSGGTGSEGGDLLNEAILRWMASDKPVEGPDQTCDFLRGAIRSIRFNTFRHQKVVRRVEGQRALKLDDEDEEPLDGAPDPAASTEGPLFVQQVYDLCGDDEEIQLLLMAQADNATPEQIKADLNWDDRKYEAVRKRKRRLMIRLMREGKLL